MAMTTYDSFPRNINEDGDVVARGATVGSSVINIVNTIIGK